jgi:hypothetical protein
VPYATSYWQVGDTSKQNGRFKMEKSWATRNLASFKSDKVMKIGINYSNVMSLINKSWNFSFGIAATNQEAIADRGWYPPNRNLLLHPDFRNENHVISNNNNNQNRNELFADPLSLNVIDGKSGSCLDKIIKHCSRNGGVERQQANINDGKSITEALDSGRKLPSGLIVFRGLHSLNNPDVLEGIWERRRIQDEKETRRNLKVRDEAAKPFAAIVSLRMPKPDKTKWSQTDWALNI